MLEAMSLCQGGARGATDLVSIHRGTDRSDEAMDAAIGYAGERLPAGTGVRHLGDAFMSRATFRTILGLMAVLFLGIASCRRAGV